MARSIWSGSISFGLVNIPVKLYTAVRELEIHFHLLHDQDKARLQRRMVCSADGKEVHPEHMVRGYEVAPDQYVVIRQEELDNLAPEASRTIDIRDFVDLEQIDPAYYDRPYYLAPDERAAKAYRLLLDAMLKTKKVAIATFVMRNKQYLSAIRALESGLCLETMNYGDEVSKIGEVPGLPLNVKVQQREVDVAERLIGSLTTEFDPGQYKDEYRQRVMELVELKARGEEIHLAPAAPERPGPAVDLMAALEASLAHARTQLKTETGRATGTSRATQTHKGETKRHHTRRRKGQ